MSQLLPTFIPLFSNNPAVLTLLPAHMRKLTPQTRRFPTHPVAHCHVNGIPGILPVGQPGAKMLMKPLNSEGIPLRSLGFCFTENVIIL